MKGLFGSPDPNPRLVLRASLKKSLLLFLSHQRGAQPLHTAPIKKPPVGGFFIGGGEGIRTPVHAFAERCLTPRPHHQSKFELPN